MVEKFSKEEQTAVASVLYNLAGADFRSHTGETQCLKDCLAEIGFDSQDFVPIPRHELEAKAYETIKRMSKEKKHVFSRMMTQMARADGHFGPLEQAFVKEILEYCEVPFVHK